jgi:predicted PurR-regulated permease PerM
VGTLVVPAVSDSADTITTLIQQEGPGWVATLKQYGFDTSFLQEKILSLDKNQLLSLLVSHTGSVLSNLMDAASTAVGVVGTVVISLVLSFYLLADKQMLSRQVKKLLRAYLPARTADSACRIGALISRTFARFLSGQCVEAVILGCLMFAAFSVFRLPYAGLVAVLTAVCAFIPYIGAFLSCAVAAVLNLMIDPLQALISVAVFQVVQFVEGQFIYPRVVGGSIGLPSLWTLVAAVLGGKLFGVVGMIFFIPAFAVLYALLRGSAEARLTARGTAAPKPPESAQPPR